MTRIWISLGILLTLTGLSIGSEFAVHTACSRYAAEAQVISDALAAGDTAGAIAACDAMDADWGRFRTVCRIFVTGEKLAPIREELDALRPMLAAALPESAASAERLRSRIRNAAGEAPASQSNARKQP